MSISMMKKIRPRAFLVGGVDDVCICGIISQVGGGRPGLIPGLGCPI
jgi:hypothetical protein